MVLTATREQAVARLDTASAANRQGVARPGTVHINTEGQNVTLSLTFSAHPLKDAHQRIERREFDYATTLAHAACDLHTEGVLRVLLARKCPEPAVAELIGSFMKGRSTSLDNDRAREVYCVLTGHYPAGLWHGSRAASVRVWQIMSR